MGCCTESGGAVARVSPPEWGRMGVERIKVVFGYVWSATECDRGMGQKGSGRK